MRPTDQLLARYSSEVEDRQQFIDGVVEDAEREGRDLTAQELELITRARERLTGLNEQMGPLEEIRRIGSESASRIARISEQMTGTERPREVEYRSAGAFVLDYWRAGLGFEESSRRIELYQRAAAHQTTADNPGLLPEKILGPVVNFVDESRPIVTAIGPRQLPSGSWSRPKVTQHTNVAEQAGEKTELVSRKMTIGKLPVAAKTYGGYVNVSRQDIDWTEPQIMDIVIADLAGYYASVTEDVAGDALVAAAVAEPPIPTGPATPAAVATALWAAAGNVYAATKGQGRLIAAVSPDMLGLIGPLFAPINPQNAQSPGFAAGNFDSGVAGAVSGITVVMGPQLSAGTFLVFSTAAFEVYEDRIGSLQVVEPSVLGVQVAYAGYFAPLVIEANGIRKIAKTP